MAGGSKILVVDDDPIISESLAAFLEEDGHATATAGSVGEALELLARAKDRWQVVISDVSMPGKGGLDLLRGIRESHPSIAVVMLTGYGTIESAVEALRLGAVDYLTKPVMDEELRLALERAIAQHKLLAENAELRKTLDRRFGLDGIVGGDARMRRVFELVEAVSESKTTVLMEGESGTGKSLIARAIHHRSPRAKGPFVEISCGSIPETLLESELFGHVQGAFTGAHVDKEGKFLAADGGTIFLDEINSAPPAMQLKLLRVLQERKFEPVGSNGTIEVDVRVILAANEPLENLVADGRFRQDLYYRVNVIKVELPPLRDRVGDVPVLAEHFLAEHASELGKALRGFSAEALDALRRYGWPGNVRELSNVVERAAVLSRGETIELSDLPPQVITGDAGPLGSPLGSGAVDDGPWEPMPLVEALKAPERRILIKALEANEWNRQKTAEQLDINRTTLYKKMKTFGIEEPRRAG
ncbi:MAG: sigma-54 dependent transcriptional regulator [Planctomycetota bacterium]